MKKVYSKMEDKIGCFVKTKEKIEITFDGWDGKSYNGETRKMNVWIDEKNPDKKFVCVRKSFGLGEDKYKADCIMEVTDVLHETTNVPIVEYFTSFEVDFKYE